MIITKGGEYSLKYVTMWCEVTGVVSKLIAVIEKSNQSFLIWGLFESRGTPQLSLCGYGMNYQKQRSKKMWFVWCTIICWVMRRYALSLLRLTVFRKFWCLYDLFILYTMLCCICFGHTAPDSYVVSLMRLLIMCGA